MPTRNKNNPLRLFVLAISLVSASPVNSRSSNGAAHATPTLGKNQLITDFATPRDSPLFSHHPIGPTHAPVVEVEESVGDRVRRIVNSMLKRTVTATRQDGHQADEASIKKGGGGAGTRGSGGSSGGSSGSRGSGGRGGSSDIGGSGGSRGSSSSSSSNRGGGYRTGGSNIGSVAGSAPYTNAANSAGREDDIWIPLGLGLLEEPSWAHAIGGPGVVMRAVSLACVTAIVVYGML
ncbi:hypothetical protein F5Y09DRAFT_347432 [Xylaria sp. FL1042]|nr:hypothetical protein F5Y09DRAFT_347432 [Xylaria sp. FL1042]